jgi:hypothetical protein
MFNWFRKKKPNKVIVWDVIEGPIHADEIEDPGGEYLNICRVEVDGKVHQANFWFDTEDAAYIMINHFKQSIEPLEMEIENE